MQIMNKDIIDLNEGKNSEDIQNLLRQFNDAFKNINNVILSLDNRIN